MGLMVRDDARELMHAREREPEYVPSGVAFPEEAEGGIWIRLRRRKLLFAAVFLGTLGMVAGAYLYLPARYKAEAVVTIAPSSQVLASQSSADGQQNTIGDSADLESQAVVLSSPMLLRELLQQPPIRAALLKECEIATPPPWKETIRSWLQFDPHQPCPDQLADTTGMVGNLAARTSVVSSGRSRILILAYVSPSPEVAQIVANGIVQAYLDARTREKLEPRDQAIDWLHAETKRLADRLNQTESNIEAFLHANGVVKGQSGPIASEQLTGLAQQIGMAEAERAAAAGRMQQAQVQGGVATSGVLESRTVNDAKDQLNTVTAQIAQYSSRYGSAYPALAALQEQRRSLERIVSSSTGNVTRSAVADYQAANSRVASLRQQLDALKQEVRGNDDAATQVAAMQRDVVTDRELFVDLSKSLNQLETNRRLVTPNARLVSWAELPRGIFFPKATTFGLTGVLLATAFATAAALLRDRADRTVRTVPGLQSAAELRVLARIPHVPRVGRGSSQLVSKIQRPSAFQEAIRGLYAECLLVSMRGGSRERPLRSFMITSSDQGEGKTFTALALAHFAAAAGQRVIVLECDLRRPSIGRSLGMRAAQGVSEILRGQAMADDVVCSTASPGLDVILAGKAVMNSAELLAGSRLAQLLDWATARYDLVLVDTPPARVLADARILAPAVDAILYCAQWGHSNTDVVVEGLREIRAVGGRVQGLVLDGVQQTHYRLYDKLNAGASDSYLVAEQG